MNTGTWRSMNEEELTELFRRLGAPDPEGWARSQIREGIPQLGRYAFLREAWRLVIGPRDQRWMTEMLPRKPDDPGGEFGPAIERLLATGARPEDLTTIVRIMQWGLLFGLCFLLDDPGGDIEAEVPDLAWQLFLVDENGEAKEPIGALHESVLHTDPTGREMRPPGAQP
jgi:hypothetical protein